MKRLALLFVAIALFSCSNEKPKDPKTAIFVEEELKAFVETNPELISGKPINEEIIDKFKHKVINLSNEPSFLNNIPFSVREIKDSLINGQAVKIAKLDASFEITLKEESLPKDTATLQVLGIVSPDQLKDLSIGKKYKVTGTLYRQGKRADINVIQNQNYHKFELGKYTFAMTGFKP